MNKFKVWMLFLLSIGAYNSYAQFTDRYWTFGDSAGINFKNLSNPVPGESILRARGTCASICDSLGDLLFYGGSPNQEIWRPLGPPYTYNMGFIINSNHQKIVNGDSLKSTLLYSEMVIVPNPANLNQFYIFTAGETSSSPTGFFYNILDLSLNNGDGYVIQKNVQLQSFTVADCMTAIKHGNGRDWWVIIREWSTTVPKNSFYVYLISASGISLYNQQNIGNSYVNGGLQRLEFNSSGDQFYACNGGGLIERFDFDRCTGVISNEIVIAPFATTWRRNYWSMAVSPDDSKLYVSTLLYGTSSDTSYLVQYDLNATNFFLSADTLLGLPANNYEELGLLQPGPDGKIYLSARGNSLDCGFDYLYCDTTWNLINSNISVINYPDSAGAACDFQPFSFNLGGHRAYYGLPNNPNYELGPLVGSPCDSLTVGIIETVGYKNNITVYYDVNWQVAFVNAKGLRGKKFAFELYNINGQLIQQQQGMLDSEYYTNNLSLVGVADGLYVVRLKTDKEVLTGKFVKR
ncbi:MAG: hypothetical protein RL516_2144 [Bacteroidota bacterium]|jgi:hypothetical protein